MTRPLSSSIAAFTLASTVVTAALVAVPPAQAEVRRLETRFEALGGEVTVTIEGLEDSRARLALAAAEEEIREIESLVAPDRPGSHSVDRRVASMLERARRFCLWSEGAHGPLGGALYASWGVRSGPAEETDDPARDRPGRGRPSPAERTAAVESARCTDLATDVSAGTVTLPAGAVVDLQPFAAGFAVDRAVEALRAAGATNVMVQIGPVVRAAGPGPEGRGWPIGMPAFPGLDGPPPRYRLRDQALAIAAADADPLIVGGDRLAPFLDQRTGLPARGVVATIAATELAIDAQALAVTAFILGTREGTYLLGQLEPAPAVQWLLGSGSGQPLISSYRWSQLATD